MAVNVATTTRRRIAGGAKWVEADIAVVGAGVSGISAAIEAAKLGRRVVLIDGAPSLGGQSVGAIIGTFCGFYSNGPDPFLVTHGIVDDILRDLGAQGALNPIRGRRNTIIVQYNEMALARWMEEAVRRAGIEIVLGAVLREAPRDGGRIRLLRLATRYGDVEVAAQGYVDASGDAALTWLAGLPCQEPDTPIYGTQMLLLEQVEEAALAKLDRAELQARLKLHGGKYGLTREDGFVFGVPGAGLALVNMTHLAAPLDPLGASHQVLVGHALADAMLRFLKDQYPGAFAKARMRSYGLPGIRQSRWIVGRHHLLADEVRQGIKFADAVGRCSWPIELHHREDGVHWEEFGDDHMHWIPLGAMVPPGADNLVAAGRCADGDPAALSSIRVMGPCIAMGAAAAHALDLAGAGSVHQIDIAALQTRLADNLERKD